MQKQLLQNRRSLTVLQGLFILLLILGLFFRFVNLDKKVYWHDEVYTSLRITAHTRQEVVERAFIGNEVTIAELQEYQRIDPKRSLSLAINLLGIEDAQHPPLYYVLLRFWVQWLGESVTVIRSFSAFVSLLTFPCLYWLCRELFDSYLTGWIAIALTAVSPLHVLLAQEAREYGLWTVTVLLSSAALIRAMRVKTSTSWMIYTLTLVLALYSFLFSALVMVSHGVYVLVSERFRWNKVAIAYLSSSGVGLLLFSPWFYFLVTYADIVESSTAWTADQVPFSLLIQTWIFNLSRNFLDFDFDLNNLAAYFLILSIVALEAYSFYFLCQKAPNHARIFILSLTGVTTIILLLPDLLVGGQRSTVARYFIPCYLGIQVTVAYFFSQQVINLRSQRQRLSKFALAILISVGVASCTISSQADTWWLKAVSYHNPKVAQVINQAAQPLVVSDAFGVNPGNVISLSYLLKPSAKFLLLPEVGNGVNTPKFIGDFGSIFLFGLPDTFRDQLQQRYGGKMVHIVDNLWQFEKSS